MKAILIIAHHCILPGAYKGFEGILDKLHHDLPGTRVASTSLLDLENDLRTLLREDVESVTLLPFLLLNGQHTKNDVPRVVAKLQAEYPQIPITLMPCLGDWKEFASMVVDGIRNVQNDLAQSAAGTTSYPNAPQERAHSSSLFSIELNLEGRNVLVVGGGRIALRKVKTLLPRPYEPLDLRGIFMVFICTDKPAVNAQVSNDARARRILVNNACDYLDGDFIVPARMDFGENIAVTVSTQGRAPSLAKKLKQKIQEDWGESLVQVERDFLH